MELFLDALRKHTPSAVSAFLDTLHLNFDTFTYSDLCPLYSVESLFEKKEKKSPSLFKSPKVGVMKQLSPPKRHKDKDLCMKNYAKARQTFLSSVRGKPANPYPNHEESCIYLDAHADKQDMWRQKTCLKAQQELFLWSLWTMQPTLAQAFWARCQDKIASALFARAFLNGRIMHVRDAVDKTRVEKLKGTFETLAIETTRRCYEMHDERTTELLLKPCPDWGNLTVLQIAILTECKAFTAQEAFKERLKDIWLGNEQGFVARGLDGQRQRDNQELKTLCCHMALRNCRDQWNTNCRNATKGNGASFWYICKELTCPRGKFCFSVIWQLAFLGLFAYSLLFDMNSAQSPTFIILALYVADYAAEECRQLFFTNHHLLATKRDDSSISDRIKFYSAVLWNWLDVFSVIVFVIGSACFFSDSKDTAVAGRVLLSIDVLLYHIRLLQMMLVSNQLGGLLVMAKEMFSWTVYFMVIMMTLVIGVAVATEGILYNVRDLSWRRSFFTLWRAYWMIYGELSMDSWEGEFNLLDNGNGTEPQYHGYPTDYGIYLVPVMFGVFIVISNVLLLNLLIAKFNAVFEKVQETVDHHQAWVRCQTIMEICTRSCFPPPLNLLRFLGEVCLLCHCSCCSERDTTDSANGGGQTDQNAEKHAKDLEDDEAKRVLAKIVI